MQHSPVKQVCKSCGFHGVGKYCSQCGQAFEVKRITLSGLLHDVFHLFTHLDKGFLYTVKHLIISPGKTQRNFIEGIRNRFQKPFSMFFICATISALMRYASFEVLIRQFHTGSASEAEFWHQGMVLLQILLMPFFILLTYLFFNRSKYNYAEYGVLLLYTFSIFFLTAGCLNMLRFIWSAFDIAYIEFPIYSIYFIITFLNFFSEERKWLIILKSLLLFTLLFYIIQVTEDFVIKTFY